METRYVSRFAGQAYGFNEAIRIAFHNDSGLVRYPKGFDEHGYYHLDNRDIQLLSEKYPKYIPPIGHEYYDPERRNWVQEWGYDVEEGLCLLMMTDGLILPRKNQGITFECKYVWEPTAPPWNAMKKRSRRRRFPKAPWLLDYDK